MTFENVISKPHSNTAIEHDVPLPLVSLSDGDICQLLNKNKPGANNDAAANGDLKPGTIPGAGISERGDLHFCTAPVKETPEQKLDQKIKDTFGADVYQNLNNWDWLIAHKDKLKEGFGKKMSDQDKWDMAKRMSELSKVDGKPVIYLERLDGPTRGSIIPKRHDIKLRREVWSDDYLGHAYPR
ncbi:MAG TPA: hypothetical protein V6C69_16245 [Trichormus sp.]|jgi:hypothetical protein